MGQVRLDGNLFVGIDQSRARAGQKVTGVLVCVTHHDVQATSLSVNLHGVEIGQTSPGSERNDEVVIVDTTVTVWEGKALSQGTHTFQWELVLPQKAPASCNDGTVGSSRILYTVKPVIDAPAAVDGPPRFRYDGRPLKVLEDFPIELLIKPLRVTSSKTFLLDFGGRGPTRITVSVPRQVLFLGEAFPMTLTVDNPSSKTIDGISVIITERRTTSCSSGDELSSSTPVLEHSLPSSSIPPKSSVAATVAITTPPLQCGSVTKGKLVSISHSLEVKLHSKMALACSVKAQILLVERTDDATDMEVGIETCAVMQHETERLTAESVDGEPLVCGMFSEPNQHPRKGGNEDMLFTGSTEDGTMHVVGVLDGHGGPDASAFLAKRLPVNMCGDSAIPTADMRHELIRNFLESDQQLLRETATTAGACGCVVAITATNIACANCGDSRALLVRANGECVALSEDHRPSRVSEKKRIEEAGGIVMQGRVYGILAVSRSFGDREFKRTVEELTGQAASNSDKDGKIVIPEGSKGGSGVADDVGVSECAYLKDPKGTLTPVTALPEVLMVDRHKDDNFLIVACDGLFDTMPNDEAARFVHRALRAKQAQQSIFNRQPMTSEILTEVARDLVMEAGKRLGHHDDISIAIVSLSATTCAPQQTQSLGKPQGRDSAGAGGGASEVAAKSPIQSMGDNVVANDEYEEGGSGDDADGNGDATQPTEGSAESGDVGEVDGTEEGNR